MINKIINKISIIIKKKEIHIISLFVLLPFIFFGRLFFQNSESRLYIGSDFVHYFTAFHYFVDRLRELSFPFWDPYMYQGLPFAARADLALFYPINLVWAFVAVILNLDIRSLYIWYEAYVVFHLSLAGIFCYYLAKDLKISNHASIFAGIVFMFSGSTLMFLNTVPLATSMAWLPLIFLFYRRSLYGEESKEKLYVLLTAFFLAVSHFAGYIQMSLFYNGILLLLFYLYWLSTTEQYVSASKKIIKLLYLFAAFLLSVLIYAIQLVPAINLLSNSNRGVAIFDTAITYGAINPASIFGVLLPNIFRYWDGNNVVNIIPMQLYFGILPLILFIVALVYSKNKKVAFFPLVFFIFLLASFGAFTSIYEYMVLYMPKLISFRNVNKIVYLAAFSLSIVSAKGFDIVVKKYVDNRQDNLVELKKIFGWFAGVSLFVILFSGLNLLARYSKGVDATVTDIVLNNFNNSVIIFILFFLISILLLFYLGNNKNILTISLIIYAFLFIDFANFNKFSLPNTSRIDPKFYFSKDGVDYFNILADDKGYYRIKFINGIYGAHYAPEVFKIYNSNGYSSFVLEDASRNLLDIDTVDKNSNEFSKKLGELSVKYIISGLELNNEYLELISSDKVKSVNKAHYFKYGGDSIGIVNMAGGERVYMYKNKAHKEFVESSAKYEIESFKPERTTIKFNSEKDDEKVVLRMYAYPGWHIFIDGSEIEQKKTKNGFIKFKVPVGESRVEVVYAEKNFFPAAIVTLGTCLICLFFVFKYGRKKNIKLNK